MILDVEKWSLPFGLQTRQISMAMAEFATIACGNGRICTLPHRKFGICKLSIFSEILEKIFFVSN